MLAAPAAPPPQKYERLCAGFDHHFWLHSATYEMILCTIPFKVSRAVASLTVPGGQEIHFPHFFLKFRSIFPQTLLILPHFGPPCGTPLKVRNSILGTSMGLKRVSPSSNVSVLSTIISFQIYIQKKRDFRKKFWRNLRRTTACSDFFKIFF